MFTYYFIILVLLIVSCTDWSHWLLSSCFLFLEFLSKCPLQGQYLSPPLFFPWFRQYLITNISILAPFYNLSFVFNFSDCFMLFCGWVFYLRLCLSTIYMPFSQKSGEGIASPRAGVDSFLMCLNPGLKEQPVLLIAEPWL